MIQKGIVESIISAYEYKVRIPRYDKLVTTPGGVSTEDLSSAIVCSTPGTKLSYAEGDIVLVGFENGELNKPIILGALYKAENGEPEQFISPVIQEALSKYESDIQELKSNKLYTHLKYSNDNGITFTSLYEYTDISYIYASQSTYVTEKDIVIDSNSSVIYWSVIDSNNLDVTSQLQIKTTLYSDDNNTTQTFTDKLIYIPIKFKGLNKLKLSFSILCTEEFNDYHIVLTTDKNAIGSVYGDYIGICVSTDPIPPTIPSLYTWTSMYESIEYLVNKLENLLLPRVERNEEALYGFNYSTENQVSDSTGLLDGIVVSPSTIDIHGVENKNINFSVNKSMYIDNKNNSFILNDLEYTDIGARTAFSDFYTTDGHLRLLAKTKI